MFAERQIYLRSGGHSRYVVISRPLQVGVALAFAVGVIWLGLASYSAIASHFQLADREREVSRLEGLNRSLRAAAETASADQVQAEQLRDLQAQLETAIAARDRATQLAETTAAEALELKRELALSGDEVKELRDRLDALTAELQLATQTPADEAEGEDLTAVANLRNELEASARQLEAMAAEQAELRAALEAADDEAAVSRDKVAEVVTELEASQAEVDQLRAALAEAEALAEGQPDLEQELAEARAEADQLQQALARAEAEREALVAQVRSLSPPRDGNGEGAPAVDGENGIPPEIEARLASLSADLEGARQEVQDLQRAEAAAQAEIARLSNELDATEESANQDLQRLSAQLDEIKIEDGVTTVIPAFLEGAERVVDRLDQDLQAARTNLDRLQQRGEVPPGLDDIKGRLDAASRRISQLDLVVNRMRARETALQIAISNVIPSPPPAAPR